jgi:large conductance mechanosensitive channel
MSVVGEFRDFIKRGNVIDLAVGVIIGASFGKIVASVTEDLLMPVLSLFTGKLDFTNLFVTLDGSRYATLKAAKEAGATAIAYGSFLTQVINFLIVAFVIFLIVKQMNRLLPPPPPPAPAGPTPSEALLAEIRDLLKRQ